MPRILLSSQTLVHLENPEFLPEHSLDNIEKCYDRIREEEIKLKMWTSPKERKELQLQIYDFALQCVRKGDLRLGFKHLGISIDVANRPSLDAEERRASDSAKTLRLVMLLESPAAQGEEESTSTQNHTQEKRRKKTRRRSHQRHRQYLEGALKLSQRLGPDLSLLMGQMWPLPMADSRQCPSIRNGRSLQKGFKS